MADPGGHPAPALARRLLNYVGLIDAITDRLAKDGIAGTKGLNTVGFGRWMRVHGRFDVFLKVSPTAWYEHGATPLWCEYGCAQDVAQRLGVQLGAATVRGSGKSVVARIPIPLKTGVERDAVIDDAVERMRRIADALSKACPPSD